MVHSVYLWVCCYVFIFSQLVGVIALISNEVVDDVGHFDLPTQNQQWKSDSSVIVQGATNYFADSALDSSLFHLSPYPQFDLSTSPNEKDSENTAFLIDGGDRGVDISIPSEVNIPIPSVNPMQIFQGIPEFINDVRQWFSEPQKPECKDGKFVFCCDHPGPKPKVGRRPGRPPFAASAEDRVLEHDPVEYSQRKRHCTRCMRSQLQSRTFYL